MKYNKEAKYKCRLKCLSDQLCTFWVVVGVITFPTSYFIILSVINAQQVENGKKVVGGDAINSKKFFKKNLISRFWISSYLLCNVLYLVDL